MENEKKLDLTNQFDIFQSSLGKYEKAVSELLGSKFGIKPQEFLVKVSNAIRNNPELLRCSPQSLFGSILYFAEIGLPFNTPEGYGYISAEFNNGLYEAVPIVGYRGLIEIAYRNPKVKSIRIQAVYSEDFFEYEYGTNEFIKHRPNFLALNNKNLIAVYAIAKIEGIDPMFVVVHKSQIDELKKLNKVNEQYKKFDVFNIMESKIAIKLLFKTLPKTDNETLLKVLDIDNKFDYDKNVKISATENGYELVEVENNSKAIKDVEAGPIDLIDSLPQEDFEIKYESTIQEPVINIDLQKPFLKSEEIKGTIQEKQEGIEVTNEYTKEEAEKIAPLEILVTDKALEEDKLTRPESELKNEKFQEKKKELEEFFDFSLIKLHEGNAQVDYIKPEAQNEQESTIQNNLKIQDELTLEVIEPIVVDNQLDISIQNQEKVEKIIQENIQEEKELKIEIKSNEFYLESILEVIEPINLINI